jgi:hypothetical protein
MQTAITIRCLCDREVIVQIIGGQYQDEYQGDCEYGRKWLIKELSEALVEISDSG